MFRSSLFNSCLLYYIEANISSNNVWNWRVGAFFWGHVSACTVSQYLSVSPCLSVPPGPPSLPLCVGAICVSVCFFYLVRYFCFSSLKLSIVCPQPIFDEPVVALQWVKKLSNSKSIWFFPMINLSYGSFCLLAAMFLVLLLVLCLPFFTSFCCCIHF